MTELEQLQEQVARLVSKCEGLEHEVKRLQSLVLDVLFGSDATMWVQMTEEAVKRREAVEAAGGE